MSAERVDEDAGSSALPWLPLLPWQERPLTELLAQRDTLAHALLIYGPRGIGKHAWALGLAQALLCESPRPDGLGCGTCDGCRYAIAGGHPDLMRLELLQTDPDTGLLATVDQIAVDRVRALIDFAEITSHRHRAKVAVVAPADRMNPSAANALLKTLEEPPPGTYMILVSEAPGRLAPTVVSRCRKLRAPMPTAAEARAWLVAQGVGEPDAALALAGGAPLTALSHANAGVQDERRAWIAALADPVRLSPPKLAARIDAAGKDERRARLAWAIEWLLAWTADLARVASGAAARQNPDSARSLAALASRVARVRLFGYHRALLLQRAQLAHPLVPRLVAEALLADYRGLFA